MQMTGQAGTLLRVGLLGHGSIAAAHVEALRAIDRGEVVLRSVMGRLAEPTAAFAAEHGFARSTTQLDAILDDPQIDAVIVCSPSDAHAEQTAGALRAGKHVLCEIPLATSLSDVDRLIALAAALLSGAGRNPPPGSRGRAAPASRCLTLHVSAA